MTHVPYKGEAPMLQDLVSGQVTWAMGSLASARPYIEAGRLRALAVSGDKRVESLPKVPSFAEVNLRDPELVVTGNVLLMAPIATPKAVIAKLEDESLKALDTPAVRARMQLAGFVALGNDGKTARPNYDTMYPVQEKLFKQLNVKRD